HRPDRGARSPLGCARRAGSWDHAAPLMDPATVIHDCALPGRGAGTDAERRSADALAGALRASGREVAIEPVWVRPQWAFVQAVHVALLVGGGLLAIEVPAAGLALLAVA